MADGDSTDPTEPVRSGQAWLLLLLPPLVPLLGAAAILQFITHPELSPANLTGAFAEGRDVLGRHMADRMIYAAAGFFHIVVCLGAIVYFLDGLRRMPTPLRRRGHLYILAALVVLTLTVVLLRAPQLDFAVYKLTYVNIREILRLSLAEADLTRYVVGDFTKLSILVYIPTLFGMVAVITAAALATAAAGELPRRSDGEWRRQFVVRVRMLQQAFYVLSAVLVTSTITIMLFFQLPVALAGDDATRMALSAYAQGLTAFWGTVFTLTLIATFVPATLILRHRAQRYRERLKAPQEFQTWLTDQVPVTVEKQIRNLAAMFAPLIIGLLGNVLQSVVRFG
ncbi:MAG: hypothetical protein OEU09_20780 [Rhodospirillales bacterium]|nr:hypothetical protein [Rhodospirillales bacterium]MDH3913722.1 hypothetical protein [Rhodospirillales bacterium]MDH3965777.1 hypothetical protein [Rhodospirillales bacterium]